jgi:hypothetical protein
MMYQQSIEELCFIKSLWRGKLGCSWCLSMEVLMLLLHSFTTSRHGMYKKDWQQTYALASATMFLLLLHWGCLIKFLNKQLLYFLFQQDIQRLQPGPYFSKALKLTVLMTGLNENQKLCIIFSPHPSWLCMEGGELKLLDFAHVLYDQDCSSWEFLGRFECVDMNA